jgi:hypothetical protein
MNRRHVTPGVDGAAGANRRDERLSAGHQGGGGRAIEADHHVHK